MGSSGNQTKIMVHSVPLSFTCPKIINKDNWVRPSDWIDKDHFPDTFSVEQRETDIVVTRTDLASGWDMELGFECCANGKFLFL